MKESVASGVAGTPPGDPDLPESPAEMVERWWTDHFPGSPVAQMTQAWNHAFAAKEELKRRLANLLGSV